MKIKIALCLFYLLVSSTGWSKEKSEDTLQPYIRFEYGFVSVLDHRSQWGESGTKFNYGKDGAQDVLFPTWRLEIGAALGKHLFSFMYQPLSLESESVLRKDLKIDNITFESGTDLLITYDFPFYRFSYWYQLVESKYANFWLGAAIQIRNTSIAFRNRTGTQAFRTGNVGPVPLLLMRMENNLTSYLTLYTTLNGFWAPIKYLNGGSADVNGWIYEFEFQPVIHLNKNWMAYTGVRLLGGGAIATANTAREPSGGKYSEDILLTLSFTAGVMFIY